MSATVRLATNSASAAQIARHLHDCSSSFVPPLSGRVVIADYAQKIKENALCCEAWHGETLSALVAVYCNERTRGTAFVTSVSVLPAWQGQGLAATLLRQSADSIWRLGFGAIELEVDQQNIAALRLYARLGFSFAREDARTLTLRLECPHGDTMTLSRDYNDEIQDTADHQYAYRFDFDVMHPFMVRSFAPFFRPGNLLELGSFKGDFTLRLRQYFSSITCVEASDAAIALARRRLGDSVSFVNGRFETAVLPDRYDNIILTHVLEHLDDPVAVLKRINDEWLADGGRLFLVCPNANAPSRQIAVKMGLISHNAAVTPAEAAHGHRRTYAFDTLERDAVASGLKVVYRSGIFFKALANFQWDRLLQTDIVSTDYLEGCYRIGQQYPDLCASVFLLCERGTGR